MIEFAIGFGFAVFLIMFIGWVDVAIFNKPLMTTNSKVKAYMILTAWEMMFFICGAIIGYII